MYSKINENSKNIREFDISKNCKKFLKKFLEQLAMKLYSPDTKSKILARVFEKLKNFTYNICSDPDCCIANARPLFTTRKEVTLI